MKQLQTHTIHFDRWPIDCLITYLKKKQRLLVTSVAPKIKRDFVSLSRDKSPGALRFKRMEQLFASTHKRLLTQINFQEQFLFPYMDELLVATEKKSPVYINSFSVVYDSMESIRQDHLMHNNIFDLMKPITDDAGHANQDGFIHQIVYAIEAYKSELFHIMNLQRKVLLPCVCRMASRC